MNDFLGLDTNILIYLFDQSSEFHPFCRQLYVKNTGKLAIASKAVAEFCSVLSKNPKMTTEKVLKDLDQVLSNFIVLNTSGTSLGIFRDLFQAIRPSGNHVYDLEIRFEQ